MTSTKELALVEGNPKGLMTTDRALSLVGDFARDLPKDEQERITERRVNALTTYVTKGLVKTEDEVATALDLFTHYDASPSTVGGLLVRYPTFSIDTVAQVYEARSLIETEKGGATIKGLAELTSELGSDTVIDPEFLDGLDALTSKIADGLRAARERQKGYVGKTDIEKRVAGIAFRMAVEQVRIAYEEGLDIHDLINDENDGDQTSGSDDYSDESMA